MSHTKKAVQNNIDCTNSSHSTILKDFFLHHFFADLYFLYFASFSSNVKISRLYESIFGEKKSNNIILTNWYKLFLNRTQSKDVLPTMKLQIDYFRTTFIILTYLPILCVLLQQVDETTVRDYLKIRKTLAFFFKRCGQFLTNMAFC